MNNEPSLDHWTIIFLLAAAQGFFLFFLLLNTKKGSGQNHQVLATIVLVFSITLIYYVAYWTKYLSLLPYWINIIGGSSMIIAPLYFQYFKNEIGSKNTPNLWIQLLPFSIYAIYFFTKAFLPAPAGFVGFWNLETDQTLRSSFILIENLQVAVYAVLIWSAWKKQTQKTSWLKQLSIAYSTYATCFIVYYVLVWTNVLRLEYDYIISMTMAGFIYFVGYKGYMNRLSPPTLPVGRKYAKSVISEDLGINLINKIVAHLEETGNYKNSDYRLQHLSKELDLSTHLISQVLNQQMKKSFSEIISFYRIKEAKSLLRNSPDLPIISIAYQVGFSNKVSFNQNFKKQVGSTPGEYRKVKSQLTPA